MDCGSPDSTLLMWRKFSIVVKYFFIYHFFLLKILVPEMILLASGNSLGVSFPDNQGTHPLVSCTQALCLLGCLTMGEGVGFSLLKLCLGVGGDGCKFGSWCLFPTWEQSQSHPAAEKQWRRAVQGVKALTSWKETHCPKGIGSKKGNFVFFYF